MKALLMRQDGRLGCSVNRWTSLDSASLICDSEGHLEKPVRNGRDAGDSKGLNDALRSVPSGFEWAGFELAGRSPAGSDRTERSGL